MRAQYGDKIRLYPHPRKVKCGECGCVIDRDSKRYEAQLKFKDNYNPYWTGINRHREYEISRLVCEECMKKLTSRIYGMELQSI